MVAPILVRTLAGLALCCALVACKKDSGTSTGPAPTITTLTPQSGPAGRAVVIIGTGFDTTRGHTQVQVGGVNAPVVSVQAALLTVTTATTLTPGPYDVTVNVNGQTVTKSAGYTITPTLGITSLSPVVGIPGTQLTLTGIGFDPLAANNQVKINGVLAPVASATSNTLVVTVPIVKAGSYYLTLTTNNQSVLAATAFTVQSTITTVAGTGAASYGGDDGPAVSAALNLPYAVAVDAAGRLYIADHANQRIRRVDATGTITTVAGNGTEGFSGDAGLAPSAEIDLPTGVTIDAGGNLYLVDLKNQRIRKVDVGGNISTVAGTGSPGFSGDGGLATSATLNFPFGIAASGGSVYIADLANNRIRKIDASGVISTIAGNGTQGFGGDGALATAAALFHPSGIAVDAVGNVYIADQLNHRIRKVDTNGMISTVAGTGTAGFGGDGGQATSAQLSTPWGVAVDAAYNLYIADTDNNRIRKVDANGTITTLAGGSTAGFSGDNGAATGALLFQPYGVAVDASGALYIADQGNQRIRRISP